MEICRAIVIAHLFLMILSARVVRLTRESVLQAGGWCRTSRGRGDAGHLAPVPEGRPAGGSVFGSKQVVMAELEMVVDAAMSRKEALRVPR